MPATAVYQLPYPAPADPADVPLDMQELAERIEAVVGPGTANGQVPVWDNAAKKWVPVAREMAYAEVTAAVSITATTEAGATPIVTAPATTFDGATPVELEYFCAAVFPGAGAAALVVFVLFQDGAAIGLIGQVKNPTGQTGVVAPATLKRRLTPAAGSRTYSVRAYQSGGNATISAGNGGVGQYLPSYVRLRRV